MKFLQPILCGVLLLSAAAARAAPVPAAVFGFELFDTSLQGEMKGTSPAETDRLHMLDARLRQELKKADYTLVGTAPVAAEVKRQDLRTCDGCEAAMARQLGATVSVFGWVQKVSNLILNINLVMRDAKSGKMVRAGSVDIRGNTDESWRRGLDYLIANRILPAGGAPPR